MIRRLLLPALMVMAGYYAVFGGEYSALDVQRIRTDVEEARTELDELGEATRRLAERADALEHDPATLERVARERFGMIRDGEVLYRFADGGDEPAEGP